MGCSTCGQSFQWHEDNKPHHQYTKEGGAMKVPTPPQVEQHHVPAGGDVVLRMALLKAGAITELQLKQAQLWVEKGAERGHALVVEPDPENVGQNRFRLLSFEELAAELVGSGGTG